MKGPFDGDLVRSIVHAAADAGTLNLTGCMDS